jgi:hypothetical protein
LVEIIAGNRDITTEVDVQDWGRITELGVSAETPEHKTVCTLEFVLWVDILAIDTAKPTSGVKYLISVCFLFVLALPQAVRTKTRNWIRVILHFLLSIDEELHSVLQYSFKEGKSPLRM